MARRSADIVSLFLEHGIDVPGRTIHIHGPIDNDSLATVVRGFQLFQKDADVCVIVDSTGGDLVAGLGIYDTIRAHKGTVTVRVVGEACSAACILLQAGDIRLASPNSQLMHHIGENGIAGHPKNMKLSLEFYERQLEKIDALMLARINEKRAEDGQQPRTKAWWKEKNTWDRWLFPEEAVELGLLDGIYVGE